MPTSSRAALGLGGGRGRAAARTGPAGAPEYPSGTLMLQPFGLATTGPSASAAGAYGTRLAAMSVGDPSTARIGAPLSVTVSAIGPGAGALTVRATVPLAGIGALTETPGAVAVSRALAAAQKATGSAPNRAARPSGSGPSLSVTVCGTPYVIRLLESCPGPRAKPWAGSASAEASALARGAGRSGGAWHAIGEGPSGAGPSPKTDRKLATKIGASTPSR